MASASTVIPRARIEQLLKEEEKWFEKLHVKSKDVFQKAKKVMVNGVPMTWMVKWEGKWPVYVKFGKGAHFTDIDNNKFLDLCLGDTGSLCGHAPEPVVKAIQQQAAKGMTFMLPTEDGVWVGEELTRRFGLPYWNFTLTATDANRFALRVCRHLTKRKYVLVFNWCYHGTVDETFCTLDKDGKQEPRPGHIGPPVDPSLTTKVVEFNDVKALEAALAPGDVACVLAEPAMTNIGIIHPEPGYLDALRNLTRKYGTLLIIDETHTICAGPGGYTKEYKLQPDLVVMGKPIAGGLPAAVYGFSAEIADRFRTSIERDLCDTGGIGGTLSGNAMCMAAIRATLEHVLTAKAFERMIKLGERMQAGMEEVIRKNRLPWIVKRIGCRVEYWFRSTPPKNGTEAVEVSDPLLEKYMHLAALNRGILITPFHNMMLIAPTTTEADVDFHTQVFKESVENLLISGPPKKPASVALRAKL